MRSAQEMAYALNEILSDEAGASLSEFALIGSLVLVVFLLLLLALGKEN